MGTRASDVIAHMYATTGFGLKVRIEKVGRNRNRTAVSCHRYFCLSKGEKMRPRGEVMFHILEIKSKAVYVRTAVADFVVLPMEYLSYKDGY